MSDQIYGSTSFAPQPPDAQFAEMVERAQAGDQDALISFVQCYQGSVHGYLCKLVGNDDVADDLYNETVYKVCKALSGTDERLRQPRAAKKWYFTIATNLYNDYLRACKRLEIISLDHLEERFEEGDSSVAKDWHTVGQQGMPGAEEVVCQVEEITIQQRLLSKALHSVPGQLRVCFYKKDVEGLSHQEIAKSLDISESAARSYASRGRRAFLEAVAQLQMQHQREEGGI